MAKQLDYKQIASDIVNLVGGTENVQSLAHCMTRLRFVLKDVKKADDEAIKQVDGVLGVSYSGGQYMVICGKNLLPIFDQIMKDFNLSAGKNSTENLDAGPAEKTPLTLKKVGTTVLTFIQASVTPMVAGLVAGGLLKVFLLLISLAVKDFSSSSTYVILSGVADAIYYFMPIFVAYGAAKKLGGTPAYAMICAAALLHGNFTGLVAAGEAVTLFGLPVLLQSYSSTLMPALFMALCAFYVEKFLNKIIPGIFKSLFVGLGTIVVTAVVGFVVLAPLGNYIGSYIAAAIGFIAYRAAPLAIALQCFFMPYMIMAGMHICVAPFMVQYMASMGFDDVFRPAIVCHNMAEGGACLGVALRVKDPEVRSEILGIAFGCIVGGVTEPAIYGVHLRYKKPMLGVMIGGAVGGLTMGLLGARAYTMGYSSILALPIFGDTIIAAAVGILVSIVVSAVVAFIRGVETTPAVAAARK